MSTDILALEAVPTDSEELGFNSCHFTWTGTTQDTLLPTSA